MTQPFIVLGDKTTHGGTVISADSTTTTHGKPIARVGDMTVCPRCKGVFPIVAGASNVSTDGVKLARHGDATACGAKLLSSQSFTTQADGGSAAVAAAAAPAVTDSGICIDCLVKAAAAGESFVART
jgi:uncharacterized Zn-binding protein involved in type VI secretion